MTVPAKCFNIVRGRVMRITALNECCAIHPVEDAPACEVAVTDGLISVAMSAEIEAGEEINDRNWAGALCVTDRTPDEFKRWGLEFTFCGVDPSVISLMTGSPVELDADDEVVGFRTRSGPITTRFATEMWTGTTPSVCGPGETPSFGYTLLPCVVGGRMGDLTIENGRANFVVSGAFSDGGGSWGSGPYNVVADATDDPVPLPVPMTADDHHLLRLTTVAPPDADCACGSLEEADGTRPGAE